MSYSIPATSENPALVIFLIDLSGSMEKRTGSRTRLELAREIIENKIVRMIQLSTTGVAIRKRYRVAMLGYNEVVFDLLGGIKPLDEIANLGIPLMGTDTISEASRAFQYVTSLIQIELPGMQNCPAPLVCHITDGGFTGDDPGVAVLQLQQLSVPDGNVLVETILTANQSFLEQVRDLRKWQGIRSTTPLDSQCLQTWQKVCSQIPESYQMFLHESGYEIAGDAVMIWPGFAPELYELTLPQTVVS
jgi:hypothetical protein